MRTLLLGGLGLLLAGCQAPPPPPPAMSDAQKAACMRGVIATDIQSLPRLTPPSARAMAERAASQCGYDSGQELEGATADGAGFATQLQAAMNRRRVALVNGGGTAAPPRGDAPPVVTREQEIQEASELYAACIRDNAMSLARTTPESAVVVAEAATGACGTDRARLTQLGGARLQDDMDRLNRPAALNIIIRARAGAGVPVRPAQ